MRRDEDLLKKMLERAAADGGTPQSLNRIETFHFDILVAEALVEMDSNLVYHATDAGLKHLELPAAPPVQYLDSEAKEATPGGPSPTRLRIPASKKTNITINSTDDSDVQD